MWHLGLVRELANLCVGFTEWLTVYLTSNLIYSGGKYISISGGFGILTSVDGITWEIFYNPVPDDSFSYNGIVFVSWSNATKRISMSVDGVNWDTVFTIFNLSSPGILEINDTRSFDSMNGSFVLVGQVSLMNNNVFYSSDGTSWSGQHLGASGADFGTVCHVNNKYYISGLAGSSPLFYSSPDGISWSSLSSPLGSVIEIPVLFPGIGSRVIMVTYEVTTATRLWSTINDGSTWTEHALPSPLTRVVYVATDGSRYYVTGYDVSNNIRFFYGTDLISWTELTDYYYQQNLLVAASSTLTNFVTTGPASPVSALYALWQTDLDCVE